ncbi:MAG: protein kinase [Deltaproteobacteria bacterium]|jgi:serine/threonine protein kinase|nr:protein kinase [Deltaproteobacteria bacterium]
MKDCPYCSSVIPDNAEKCPVCGGDISAALGESYSCTPLDSGSIVFLKYKIEKVLGQGGFGITYLAYDEKLERKVAIKEYFPDGIAVRTGSKVTIPPTRDNEENIENFKNEAKSIAKLKNPWIVDVYDVIEENGTVYIVMEYIEGTSLLSLLGKVKENEAVKYIKQIAKAVGIIHAAGMLHQDIKPENIIVKTGEDIKIIDFGSSRVFTADKTKTYEKILTPGYAPLEQYGGKGKRGEYTDVYAICATLYALLKGFPPPEATELAGGLGIDFTGISVGLKDILNKGLTVKIPERIKNTEELLKLLDGLEKPEVLAGQELNISKIQNAPDAANQFKHREDKQAIAFEQSKNIPPENIRTDYEESSNFSEVKNNRYLNNKTDANKNAESANVNFNANSNVNYNNYGSKNKINLYILAAAIIFFASILAAAGYFFYFRYLSYGKKHKSVNSGKSIALKKLLKSKKHSKNNHKNSKNKNKITGKKHVNKTSNNTYILPTPNQNTAVHHYRYYRKTVPKTAPRFRPIPQPQPQSQASVFSGPGYEDFDMSGCFYCHVILGKGKQGGYSLSHIGSQLSYAQIENQITHPSSSMPPNPNMPAEEVAQIAGWLESLK